MLSAFTARPIIELKPRDKSKIESILAYGDQLMVGLNTGNLRIYRVNEPFGKSNIISETNEGTKPTATYKPINLLREVEKLSTKAIEQLAIIKESNILISLSNSYVSIHDLHSFNLQEQLTRTKGAHMFAITSNIVKDVSTEIPEIISRLAVCVKRKLLVWSWHESEMEPDVIEILLNDPIRTIQWASAEKLVCCLSSGFSMVNLATKSTEEIVGPGAMAATSNTSGGRFSGVGTAGMGYIGLGNYNSRPLATKLADGQILLTKDINSSFITCEGETIGKNQVPWQQAPEAIGYSYPYILALQTSPQSTLEVRNPETLSLLQSISLQSAKQLHFPYPSVSLAHAGKGFHVASERCIWRMGSTDYDRQIDELVQKKEYDEAISILNMLEDALLNRRVERLREIKILKAQELFDKKMYQDAVDIFMSQDVQAPPEEVIKLYPQSIAANTTILPETNDENIDQIDSIDENSKSTVDESKGTESNGAFDSIKSSVVTKMLRSRIKGSPSPSSMKPCNRVNITDPIDNSSTTAGQTRKEIKGEDLNNAVLALIGFLVQARNRMKAFLDSETGKIKYIEIDNRSNYPHDSFHSLFSVQVSDTDEDREEKLRETAILIDTTLFRSYMFARPQLARALFRIPNFCDPDVVNKYLLKEGRYNDLVDFFYGKKMHRPALELLRRFGTSNEDNSVPDTLHGPQRTVAYLQNLPPEMIDLIIEFAEWPLRINPDLGMEIFLADSENSESLPRKIVLKFLQDIDEKLGIKYLEHVVNDLGDTTPEFHDILIGAYLSELTSKQRKSENRKELMMKLIEFMKTSTQYSLGKAFNLIPKDESDFYEAQAVALCNMGQHKQALEIYVFKIKDYNKAEEYCNHIHQKSIQKTSFKLSFGKFPITDLGDEGSRSIPLTIYHTLLSLYLTPPPPHQPNLSFALLLLSSHGIQLPALSTLPLIPDSLTVSSLKSYFRGRIRAVNSKVNESRVVAGLRKSEVVSAQARLLLGECRACVVNNEISLGGSLAAGCRNRSVIVKEDRVCPGCHKRISNSVIAVMPHNSILHYGCLKRGKGMTENEKSSNIIVP